MNTALTAQQLRAQGFALAAGPGAEVVFQEVLTPVIGSRFLDLPIASAMKRRRLYKFVSGIVSDPTDWALILEIEFWRANTLIYKMQTCQGASKAAGSALPHSLPILCVGDWDPVVHAANDVKLVISQPSAAANEQAIATLRPLWLNLEADRVSARIVQTVNVSSMVRGCLLIISDELPGSTYT